MDVKAEVRDPNADFGWDRTESDPEPCWPRCSGRAATSPARRADCVDASETPVETVKVNFEISHLPVPAATVQCETIDEEDLTFEGFLDDKAKLMYLEAKQDLLCARGMQAGTDPATGRSSWPGVPYVDGGTWIIEPDTNDTRDVIATALGAHRRQHVPGHRI